MLQKHQYAGKPSSSSYRESIKALEADIQHANTLAASLPIDYCGDCVQMRLSYSPLAPFFLHLIEWMNCTCLDALPNFLGLLHVLIFKAYINGMPAVSANEKRASLREFYGVIYPTLTQLEDSLMELDPSEKKTLSLELMATRTKVDDKEDGDNNKKNDELVDDECGICLEIGTNKMVLPSCGHAMCISCFRDWNGRSQSCPFCRGSLKRVSSRDLWVLMSNLDVVNPITALQDSLIHFYLYIESLPHISSEPTHSLLLFDYMI